MFPEQSMLKSISSKMLFELTPGTPGRSGEKNVEAPSAPPHPVRTLQASPTFSILGLWQASRWWRATLTRSRTYRLSPSLSPRMCMLLFNFVSQHWLSLYPNTHWGALMEDDGDGGSKGWNLRDVKQVKGQSKSNGKLGLDTDFLNRVRSKFRVEKRSFSRV